MSWYQETQNGQTLYRCHEFNNDLITQAFSAKIDGNMALHTGDEPSDVIKRRQQFLQGLDLKLVNLVAGIQTHGVQVQVITRELAGAGAWNIESAIPDTDAFVTKETGVVLSIYTADCLPIFIYDPITPAIGLVHAGWRGTINGITVKAIQTMINNYGTNPTQCLVTIGPAIGVDCFTVQAEVAEQFATIYPEVVVTDNQSGYRVDLNKFNQWQLENLGIPKEHIIQSGLCTSCLIDDFYSFRAARGIAGRMMGVISLRNDSH